VSSLLLREGLGPGPGQVTILDEGRLDGGDLRGVVGVSVPDELDQPLQSRDNQA